MRDEFCAQDFVGPRIQELCTLHGITIYRLSKITGITQTAISDVIQKKTMPTILTLEKICDAFGISKAQFFAGKGCYPDLTAEQKELLDIWYGLNIEERDVMLRIVRSFKVKRDVV